MSRSDAGAATIWVLGVAGLIVLTCAAAMVRTSAVLTRHEVERSADLVALAAAEQIGRGGRMCIAARRIAAANAVAVTRCEAALDPGGRSGTVRIELSAHRRIPIVGDREVTARARAVRLPP